MSRDVVTCENDDRACDVAIADEAELLCADCYGGEPADGWAEEAPGFRLCGDCSRDRAAAERDRGTA